MEYTTEIINISKIKEGFYIGDRIAGTTYDVITQFKITHIINACGPQVTNQFDQWNIKYWTWNWSETPTQNWFDPKDEIVNRIVVFIDDSFKYGEGLLAHSLRGQDRVCIVVILYLMKKYCWTLMKCWDFLQSKKQDIDIPKNFRTQLWQYENRLERVNPQMANKKASSWLEDTIVDQDEKLMRNTFVNGLPVAKIKNAFPTKLYLNSAGKVNTKANKRRVGWGDHNPYGRNNYWITVNPHKDWIIQKEIKNVTAHLMNVPCKGIIKGRNILSPKGWSSSIQTHPSDNNIKQETQARNVTNVSNSVNMELHVNNWIYEPGNKGGLNINKATLGADNSPSLFSSMNVNNMNTNLNLNHTGKFGNPNTNGVSGVNISDAVNNQKNKTLGKEGQHSSNGRQMNSISSSTNNGKGDTSPINHSTGNNSTKDQMQGKKQYIGNNFVNTYKTRCHKNSDGNIDNNNNFVEQKKSNPAQQRSSSHEGHNTAMHNNTNPLKSLLNEPSYLNYNSNWNDFQNIRNYSIVKDQGGNPGQDNNKIIIANNFEQIVHTNINNIIIQNPNDLREKYSAAGNPGQFSGNNWGINANNSINYNKIVGGSRGSNNNAYSYTNQGKTNPQKQSQSANNQNNRFNVIEYTNNNNNQEYQWMEQQLQNQGKNQFLGYNVNTSMINKYQTKTQTPNNQGQRKQPIHSHSQNYMIPQNKPLNNFDPNLMKNNQSKSVFNRPNSGYQKGPIKIQNDFIIKKPTTPDSSGMQRLVGNNININSNQYNSKKNYSNNSGSRSNQYGSISRGLSRGNSNSNALNNKNNNNNHQIETIKRPSTAPHKDKTEKLVNDFNYNYSKQTNHLNNYTGNKPMTGTINPNNYTSNQIKRLSSPVVQSNNTLSKTQKIWPEKYRAPSPMVQSNTLNLGPYKRNGIFK